MNLHFHIEINIQFSELISVLHLHCKFCIVFSLLFALQLENLQTHLKTTLQTRNGVVNFLIWKWLQQMSPFIFDIYVNFSNSKPSVTTRKCLKFILHLLTRMV